MLTTRSPFFSSPGRPEKEGGRFRRARYSKQIATVKAQRALQASLHHVCTENFRKVPLLRGTDSYSVIRGDTTRRDTRSFKTERLRSLRPRLEGDTRSFKTERLRLLRPRLEGEQILTSHAQTSL